MGEVSSITAAENCEVSSIAIQLVLLTTYGTANDTVCEVSSSAVAVEQLVLLTAQYMKLAIAVHQFCEVSSRAVVAVVQCRLHW